jgi:hypothetical protein
MRHEHYLREEDGAWRKCLLNHDRGLKPTASYKSFDENFLLIVSFPLCKAFAFYDCS